MLSDLRRTSKRLFGRNTAKRYYETEADTAMLDVEDNLKVASLVHAFRSEGHLAAKLDPLQRVAQGPWLAETRQPTSW